MLIEYIGKNKMYRKGSIFHLNLIAKNINGVKYVTFGAEPGSINIFCEKNNNIEEFIKNIPFGVNYNIIIIGE